jgi:outer membrane protein W
MLRKGLILGALGLLVSLPTLSQAAIERPYEFTIGAGASNGNDFNGFSGNVNGSLGYYFTENVELSVRQSLSYTDIGNGTGGQGSAWNGSTRVAADYHFILGDRGQIQPFIGANLGYVYGETVNDTWEAAPEAGVKVYLNNSTFVYIQAEYQFFFKHGNVEGGFNNGQFVYTVGLGFRF